MISQGGDYVVSALCCRYGGCLRRDRRGSGCRFAYLPLWEMILGVIGGSRGVFVLNLPSRFFGAELPRKVRGAAVLVVVLFYYSGHWCVYLTGC